VLGFGITYAVLPRWNSNERKHAGLVIALTVFSHFVLDWLVHIPEMPLLGENSTKVGLGLWNNLPLALGLEVGLVLLGFIYYLGMVRPKTNLAKYGVAALMVMITVLTVTGQLLAETPPPANGAAMSWIFQPFLICGLAYWFDRKER
jgi:membrane-bound metal-dependent hydrolase YbcI (DUF457 family)